MYIFSKLNRTRDGLELGTTIYWILIINRSLLTQYFATGRAMCNKEFGGAKIFTFSCRIYDMLLLLHIAFFSQKSIGTADFTRVTQGFVTPDNSEVNFYKSLELLLFARYVAKVGLFHDATLKWSKATGRLVADPEPALLLLGAVRYGPGRYVGYALHYLGILIPTGHDSRGRI